MTLPLRHISSIVAVLLCVGHAAAQTIDSTWNVDVGLGATIAAPASAFGSVPGIASPGGLRYDPINGSTRAYVSIGADVPIGRLIRFGLRASYSSFENRHAALESAPIAVEGGSLVTATLRHDLQGVFRMIGLEPYVRYGVTPWLSVSAGLPIMNVATSKYTQTLTFVDPPGIRFVDGSIEQVTARGDVPNLRSVIPMISISAEAAIPASTSGMITLVPRIGVIRSLSSFTTDGAFNAQALNASIGVRYSFSSAPVKEPPAPAEKIAVPIVATAIPLAIRVERDTFVELTRGISQEVTSLVSTTVDTIETRQGDVVTRLVRQRETYRLAVPKPPSVLRASLQLRFVDDAGAVTDNARLSAVRVESRRVLNFLPVLVYDGAAESLPTRYRQLSVQEARSWKESSLASSTASHWQYHILNILGSRMRQARASRCRLVGNATKEGRALIERRLDGIREYLATRYGVSRDRLDTEIRSGSESDNPNTIMIDHAGGDLLDPIEFSQTYIETQLPRLQLVPDVITEAGLRSWSIEAKQGDARIREFADSAALPASFLWDMNEDIAADAAMKQPITLVLRATDIDEQRAVSEPVRVSLTSRLPLTAASQPVRRLEVFTLGRPANARQTAPEARVDISAQRQLAEWTTAGLELPERRIYEQAGMNLTVKVLERR
ncbi:MAG: hypothetical protein FGM33_06095 [Candidatus Kapabacteria bacterium]|nr:hypothetical protein [Candidatus Kapabacteria bacterium]